MVNSAETRLAAAGIELPPAPAPFGAWMPARDFSDHVTVADAASELLSDIFGKDKMSTRLVFGVESLPLGVPIELEVIFEVSA
jgi:hypothetical protein